ncbi:hypothetical protein H257_14780 [Aphanomyces astaci]|uniref:DDE Tnp4 domain-containing protein n=1 Tax=Aphanomyces astaci TaxID=112090 RepID=W4FRV0_APHAT|nr:hypothetical protein H257_14780 [Aphanomyces astaci]ETV69544.1 hypothetical protein H257_14780 [Aphanomyces astaci]|eukprot:XP_009840968.1 hypothetical protein H257_14780 [Aphanomyces astaci]
MLSCQEIEVLPKKRHTSKFPQRLRLLRLLACVVERPIIPNVRFALQTITDADSRLKFRFDVAGVQRLVVALRLPEVVVTSSRDRCLASEALCITLCRMSYPRLYYDMMATFDRSRESICRIFNYVIDFLFDKWKELLYFCDSIVVPRLVIKFETCRITQKRDRVASSFADLQRLIYSGHKRRPCLNCFQAVTAPDGLCVHFWGAAEGSRHDTTLLRLSKLEAYLVARCDLFRDVLVMMTRRIWRVGVDMLRLQRQ